MDAFSGLSYGFRPLTGSRLVGRAGCTNLMFTRLDIERALNPGGSLSKPSPGPFLLTSDLPTWDSLPAGTPANAPFVEASTPSTSSAPHSGTTYSRFLNVSILDSILFGPFYEVKPSEVSQDGVDGGL